MQTELKPCPFCGGKVSVEMIGSQHWYVCCGPENNCHSEPFVGGYATRDAAIAAWNTRAHIDALEARAAELERDRLAWFEAAFRLSGTGFSRKVFVGKYAGHMGIEPDVAARILSALEPS